MIITVAIRRVTPDGLRKTDRMFEVCQESTLAWNYTSLYSIVPDTDYYAATLQNLRLLSGATFDGNMYEDKSSLLDTVCAAARALRITDINRERIEADRHNVSSCLLYTSPSPRDS